MFHNVKCCRKGFNKAFIWISWDWPVISYISSLKLKRKWDKISITLRMATSGAASEDRVDILTILGFQWTYEYIKFKPVTTKLMPWQLSVSNEYMKRTNPTLKWRPFVGILWHLAEYLIEIYLQFYVIHSVFILWSSMIFLSGLRRPSLPECITVIQDWLLSDFKVVAT